MYLGLVSFIFGLMLTSPDNYFKQKKEEKDVDRILLNVFVVVQIIFP